MRALGFAVMLGLTVGCSSAPPEPPPLLPPAAEVVKATAMVFGTVSQQPDLPEFEIPAEFVPGLLRVLSPPERFEHLAGDREVIGWVHFTRRDGRVAVVELVYYAHGSVRYTLDGVACRRTGEYSERTPDGDVSISEASSIESFLRAVRRGDGPKARLLLARIDAAAGR
jgi:hypothetical protein